MSHTQPTHADYTNYYNDQGFGCVLIFPEESLGRHESIKRICSVLDREQSNESHLAGQSRARSSRSKVGKSGKKKVSGALRRLMGAHKRHVLKSRKVREEAARKKALQSKEPAVQKRELCHKKKPSVNRFCRSVPKLTNFCRPAPKLTKSQTMAKNKILADARKLIMSRHASSKSSATKKRKRSTDTSVICKKQRM